MAVGLACGPSRAVTGEAGTWTVASRNANNDGVAFRQLLTTMTAVNQAEILIALVVAAHAGVLAVRLCFSLYKA